MSEQTPTNPNPVTGEVLFYSRPEPLNSQLHAKIGLRRVDKPFLFAKNSNVVPLTVTEFPAACVAYPIIFAGDRRQPIAVMGVADDNLFIQDNGYFEVGAYAPAYIRRFPFVLARDDANDKLVVCVDRGAPMVGDLPDVPFFELNGEPTPYTQNCIQFCQDYEVEVRRTEAFVDILVNLDLLETREQFYTPVLPNGTNGEPQKIAQYAAVSEEKLKALPEAKIKELVDNGALSQIYAHLLSLNIWDRLMNLTLARQNAGISAANAN